MNILTDGLIEYPDKVSEWLFQKARLVVAALIVKLYATEWTPALLQTPTLQFAMRAGRWGALGQASFKAFGRPLHNDVLNGFPESPQQHYGVPYSITKDFTGIYRLHSLVPDAFSFRRRGDDEQILSCTLADLFAGGTTRVHRKVPFEDVLYVIGHEFLRRARAPQLSDASARAAGEHRSGHLRTLLRPTSSATGNAACPAIVGFAACYG